MTPSEEPIEPVARRVSIVIVTIDRADKLRACLTALGIDHQILVVDNGSTDHSSELAEEFPGARFIRLPKNFGLTKALNIGIRAADGPNILLLHDDAQMSGDAVDKLADFLEERQDVGAVAPLLLDAAGSRAPQVRPLPTPAAPDPPLLPATGDYEIAAECVSGAAIMFRAFFLRALRQIDEHYGNYGSIIELCSQVKRANRKLIVLTQVTAIHEALESPVKKSVLDGDRTVGTAVFLGKHHGFGSGLAYRAKSALAGAATLRLKVVAGAVADAKIDGTR
ncbi:MAG: glycosyltransferase [Acidobacteriota bacterium]|nr:glycosyltransferase [Acidobacteriota bacterium]